jgi:hypothetical protein
MSPRPDHAATIIAAAGDSQAHPGETDADPEPGTTTGHNGDSSGSIPPAPDR